MKSIVFLDFDGVLFDTVEEAYTVAVNTKMYEDKTFPEHAIDMFREYRPLIGPAWQYYYILESIVYHKELIPTKDFLYTEETRAFENDFFQSRKALKHRDFRAWIELNKKYDFLDKLKNLDKTKKDAVAFFIITTKDKQTVLDLLSINHIDFISQDHIFGAKSFQQYGSKRNIIEKVLGKQEYQAIFVDDSHKHLSLCENIRNLQLLQASWGYIDQTSPQQYLATEDEVLSAIQTIGER